MASCPAVAAFTSCQTDIAILTDPSCSKLGNRPDHPPVPPRGGRLHRLAGADSRLPTRWRAVTSLMQQPRPAKRSRLRVRKQDGADAHCACQPQGATKYIAVHVYLTRARREFYYFSPMTMTSLLAPSRSRRRCKATSGSCGKRSAKASNCARAAAASWAVPSCSRRSAAA